MAGSNRCEYLLEMQPTGEVTEELREKEASMNLLLFQHRRRGFINTAPVGPLRLQSHSQRH